MQIMRCCADHGTQGEQVDTDHWACDSRHQFVTSEPGDGVTNMSPGSSDENEIQAEKAAEDDLL